jgi:putative endonuclease
MATMYILICSDGRYYVGSCKDFGIRFKDHMSGKCKFTRSRIPVNLLYKEEYETLSDAKKREYQVKSWKSRSRIEKLLK